MSKGTEKNIMLCLRMSSQYYAESILFLYLKYHINISSGAIIVTMTLARL